MSTLQNILLASDPAQILHQMDKENKLAELETTLADLRMDIPKGYHHKDNLTHSINVLANAVSMEQNGTDLILRTAALFHDIGKPATRKFEANGEVTFNAHEVVGAKMVKTILRKHGYAEEQIKTISLLIRFHMRSYGYTVDKWTDSGVRRLIAEAQTKDNLNRLLVLFYSDVTTKIPQKKAKLHSNLDALKARILEVEAKDARKALRPAVNGNQIMEKFDLKPGPELGKVMSYLNSDEGLKLTQEEALSKVASMLNR